MQKREICTSKTHRYLVTTLEKIKIELSPTRIPSQGRTLLSQQGLEMNRQYTRLLKAQASLTMFQWAIQIINKVFRFETFIKNRLNMITQATCKDWRESKENIIDCRSQQLNWVKPLTISFQLISQSQQFKMLIQVNGGLNHLLIWKKIRQKNRVLIAESHGIENKISKAGVWQQISLR